MTEYAEVEEPRELRRLARDFIARVRASLTYSEIRGVSDPSGTNRRRVYFASSEAADALYWSGGLSEDRTVARSLFGRGIPGASAPLHIWLEFNIPVATFSRRFGGAFLRHIPTDRIVLAHRGIITLGRSRVRKSLVFRDMYEWSREAETSEDIRDYLLIGELDSSTLIGDISEFVFALRGFARRIQDPQPTTQRESARHAVEMPGGCLPELRDYFDEFSGERRIKGQHQTVADCYHGAVVRALRAAFDNTLALKSREVDLVVITSRRAILFEAKTSSSPQHIYTAIGQLTAHGPIVAKYANGLPLTKVIVLPEKPSDRYARLLTDTLDIRVLTFRRSTTGRITFRGLDALR